MINLFQNLIPVAQAQTEPLIQRGFFRILPQANQCFSGAQGTEVTSDFLPCYFNELFTFAVQAAIVFAIMMIMVGGFRWLMAYGNQAQISDAKQIISGAFIGLILALTSNLLLAQINSNLVNLKIDYIEKVELDKTSQLISEAGILNSADACTQIEDKTQCELNPWCKYETGDCVRNVYSDAEALSKENDSNYRVFCCKQVNRTNEGSVLNAIPVALSSKHSAEVINQACNLLLVRTSNSGFQSWTQDSNLTACRNIIDAQQDSGPPTIPTTQD